MTMHVENIPEELRRRDQWLMWDASADTPRRPHWAGDFGVSWNDPDDWHSFDEAVDVAERRESWGIGYVLANGIDDYPRGVYGGLDLDGVAENREAKDWLPSVTPLLEADEPYIEWSPSGNGLHIILAGFEPPEWWTDCIRGDHEGVEAESAKFFTVTGDQLRGAGDTIGDHGDHVEAWLADVWEAVRDEPAPPRRDDDGDESGGETAAVPSQASGNAEDIARAVDRLDAQRVAERTIADTWNDDAATSDGARAFYPSWGGADCNGTANIVGDDVWTDTGGGGKGGAQVMAAIDMNELDPRTATPDAVTGDLWWDTVDHLRDLGFAIPAYEPPDDTDPTTAAAEAVAGQSETDGGAVATGGEAEAGPMSLADRVRARVLTPLDPPEEYDGNEITLEVAINRFADLLCDEYDFLRPREDVHGWRDRLYIYQADDGIYEPHAESWIATEAERLLGAVANNQRVREIIKKIERREAVGPGELEAPPHRLVVDNGIVDLHTGELHDHTPAEHHRTKLDWAYDPEAECDRVDEFFSEIVNGSDVPTLYQLVAHCIYGEYLEEKAAMLLGDGQNGKSVYLSLLESFLGQYNVSRRSLQDLGESDFAASDLEGKLANLHPDMASETVRELDTFKKVTGRDTMTADVKYESPVHFENSATMIFAANRMPRMTEDTYALWRRWIYINFPYTFSKHDPEAKDPIPKRKLMDELTDPAQMRGLLARAVKELTRWYDEHTLFTETATPEQVRTKMKRASEPIYDFAMTCLEPADEDEWLPKDQVRDCYRQFAKAEDLPTVADNQFGERLLNIRDLEIESGQRRDDGRRVTAYNGVTLSSRGRQVLGLDEDDSTPSVDDDHKHAWEIARDTVAGLTDGIDGPEKGEVLGNLSQQMSLTNAQQAFDSAKSRGAIYNDGNGWKTT
jgi:putative DNA primase/helicase